MKNSFLGIFGLSRAGVGGSESSEFSEYSEISEGEKNDTKPSSVRCRCGCYLIRTGDLLPVKEAL